MATPNISTREDGLGQSLEVRVIWPLATFTRAEILARELLIDRETACSDFQTRTSPKCYTSGVLQKLLPLPSASLPGSNKVNGSGLNGDVLYVQ